MKITNEMITKAWTAYVEELLDEFHAPMQPMRKALEAVLSDIPEPHEDPNRERISDV